jgi:putative acetyltransferase
MVRHFQNPLGDRYSVGRARTRMIRPYRKSDVAALVSVFTESVHRLACEHYDAMQLEAWAPRPPNLHSWRERLAGLKTLVAEVDMRLAGFISYEPNGHIDLLYVSPLHSHRGIASALYREVEAVLCSEGVSALCTEASEPARPFFEHHGFHVTEEQNVEVRGVAFQRYGMRKIIAQQSVPADRRENAAPAER